MSDHDSPADGGPASDASGSRGERDDQRDGDAASRADGGLLEDGAIRSRTAATSSRLAGVRARLEGPNTIGNSQGFWIGFAAVVAVLAAYPLLVGSYGASTASLYLLYGLLGLSLSIIWGYAGILSFGQVAFFGIAGYTFGIVSLNLSGAMGSTVAIPVAMLVGTLSSVVLGYFMFYGNVRDVYVTIMTLVVTLVLYTFMGQTAGSEWALGEVALGGFNGIPAIPALSIGIAGASVSFTGGAFYWLTLVLLVGSYLGLRVLVNGNLGYAMVGVREDEDRTEMLGYDVRRVKLVVFTLGGALASASGILYVTWGNYVNPSVFSLTFASLPVVWVSVGGRRSLLGAIVATAAIEWFRQQLSVTGSKYAIVVVGVMLLLVILLLPEGVIPRIRELIVAATDRLPTTDAPSEGTAE